MKTFSLVLSLLVFIGITGCATTDQAGATAVATMQPKSGSAVTGTVTFTESSRGVRVNVRLDNVAPGVHGFHVHETGDCSAPDASSAGGHFNPSNEPHGAPSDRVHHAGDLGNVTANERGEVRTEFFSNAITVSAGAQSVVGKAIVLHTDPDDLTSQPTGNAGGRIACGVIVGPPPM